MSHNQNHNRSGSDGMRVFRFGVVCIALMLAGLSMGTFTMWRLYSEGIFHPSTEMRWWHFIPTLLMAALLLTVVIESVGEDDG